MRHAWLRTFCLILLPLLMAVFWWRGFNTGDNSPNASFPSTASDQSFAYSSLPAAALEEPRPVTSSAPTGDSTRASGDPSVFDQFDDWMRGYLSADPSERSALVSEGGKLARQRRIALATLIEGDPERALSEAVPMRTRAELPEAIVQQLEDRVDGRGDLAVIASLPVGGEDSDGVKPFDRFVAFPDKSYRAFVYGRRLAQPTIQSIPVHGIAIDGALALHESPIRALEPGETPDPTLPVRSANEDCPVSKQPSARAAVAQVGDEIVYFCTGSHIAALGEELIQLENAAIKPMASTWSQGTKTVLFMRAVFTDDTAESISDASARSMMSNVSDWFAENSYYTTEMTTTVTPPLTMPKTMEWYQTNNNYNALLTDARAVAKTNGYDTAGYNLDCVHFKSVFSGWSGRGYVGGKGTWLQSGNSVGVASHEFGHNYGLWHANFWNATGDTIIGPGSNTEYGNPFDTMGSASAGDRQFNAYEKNKLSWLPSTNVLTITNSGLYRLYAFDVPALTNNFKYALKVKKDTRDYWVEMRRKFTGNKWIQNGVLLDWSPWASSAGGSHLLDTTPGSPAGTSSKDDAAVVVGRTFSDPFAGIHITPVVKNATAPVSMDVVVNLGLFPDNQRPVVHITAGALAGAANTTINFSAYATDADGDTLAYYWDFGDQNFGTNGPTASKSWSTSGDYVVRCTATDMKGGTSSDAVVVRVGSPTSYEIAGRIAMNGDPLDGVRVYVSSTKVTYTDADGFYTLTGLGSGTNNVSAAKAGYTFTKENFSNPVLLGPSRTNMNFIGTSSTFSISGKVTDNNAGIPGVTVSAGTNQAVTGGSGTFTFTNLSAGIHVLSATAPNLELRPTFGWTNPVAVEWGNVTNKDFERPLFVVSGTISGINGAAVVSIGETNHETAAYSSQGVWRYSVMVPRGRWNLAATLNGFTIQPANFSNPLNITNTTVGGQGGGVSYNFSAVAGTTYSISGSITADGIPLAGAVVTAGPRSATTDTAGNYRFIGLTNDTYALSPASGGYTFSPAALNVVVNGANILNQDFAAVAGVTTVVLSDAAGSPASFNFKVTGSIDHMVRIESSPDFFAWETLITVTNSTGEISVTDSAFTNSQRFYRAVQLP
jgi:hypothetical protein